MSEPQIPMDTTLSVIMPVFNEVQTAAHVIESICRCGIENLQLIIVDDCSTDGTENILKQWKGAKWN